MKRSESQILENNNSRIKHEKLPSYDFHFSLSIPSIFLLSSVSFSFSVFPHSRFGLWKMGINHILNAAHGTLFCHESHEFYGTTIDYHGIPAHDLPDFDISPFFNSAAKFIHKALTTPGGMNSPLLSGGIREEWQLLSIEEDEDEQRKRMNAVRMSIHDSSQSKGNRIIWKWIATASYFSFSSAATSMIFGTTAVRGI